MSPIFIVIPICRHVTLCLPYIKWFYFDFNTLIINLICLSTMQSHDKRMQSTYDWNGVPKDLWIMCRGISNKLAIFDKLVLHS